MSESSGLLKGGFIVCILLIIALIVGVIYYVKKYKNETEKTTTCETKSKEYQKASETCAANLIPKFKYFNDGDTIALKGDNGKYLTNCDDKTKCIPEDKLKDKDPDNLIYIYGNNTESNTSTKWIVKYATGGKYIYLQSKKTNKYLALCDDCISDKTAYTTNITSNQVIHLNYKPTSIDDTKFQWEVTELNDNKIMLKNKFIGTNNTMIYLSRCDGCFAGLNKQDQIFGAFLPSIYTTFTIEGGTKTNNNS